MEETRTVLCIPGPWADRSAFLAAVIERDTGYLFAGGVLMHVESRQSFVAMFQERDEGMAAAFNAAGHHWRNTPEMDAIPTHHSVVYLLGDGGSTEAAQQLMHAAAALIKAGGLGVKVENTGVAHSPTQWLALTEGAQLGGLYRAFVVTVSSRDAHAAYSCGMQVFGLPDVRVDGVADAAALAQAFAAYLYFESPTITAGQTFSAHKDSDVFRIEQGESVHPAGDLFHNRFGTWQLVPQQRATEVTPPTLH